MAAGRGRLALRALLLSLGLTLRLRLTLTSPMRLLTRLTAGAIGLISSNDRKRQGEREDSRQDIWGPDDRSLGHGSQAP